MYHERFKVFCAIESCYKLTRVFQFCDMHYRRFRICKCITLVDNKAYWKARKALSEETREKISKVRKGKKGHPHTEEHKKYMSEIQTGPHNGMWKGDDVDYKSLHNWVYRNITKPKSCVKCGLITSFLQASNNSGLYKRDISDWEYLCRICHAAKDSEMRLKRKQDPTIPHRKVRYSHFID